MAALTLIPQLSFVTLAIIKIIVKAPVVLDYACVLGHNCEARAKCSRKARGASN